MGEGGLSGEPERGDGSPFSSSSAITFGAVLEDTGDAGVEPDGARLAFDPVDFTDPASDLSGPPSMLPSAPADALGLSVFPLLGIFDRMPWKERLDSLVSDLLNDGYDCRLSVGEVCVGRLDGVLVPEPPFDCC